MKVHPDASCLISTAEEVLVVYQNASWSCLSAGAHGSVQGMTIQDQTVGDMVWCDAITVKKTIFLVVLLKSQVITFLHQIIVLFCQHIHSVTCIFTAV